MFRVRHRKAPLFYAALASALAVPLLVACGGGSSGPGANGGGDTGRITVGVPPALDSAQIGYAQDKGLFAKYNLTVETKTLNGGAAAVPALQGGAIQVAESNVLSVIQGAQQGLNTPCFAGDFSFGVQGNPLPLVVAKDGGVTAAKDLEGKTVAVNASGGVQELAAKAYLSSQGVDLSTVKFLAVPMPNMPQAVASGQVAAATPADPFALQMLNAGGKALVNNVLLSIESNPLFVCWTATSDWLSSNPQTARSFVSAMTEASAMINADFGSFRNYLKTSGTTPPPVADNVSPIEFTTKMSRDDVVAWEKAGQKFGIIKGDLPDASKTYSPVPQ